MPFVQQNVLRAVTTRRRTSSALVDLSKFWNNLLLNHSLSWDPSSAFSSGPWICQSWRTSLTCTTSDPLALKWILPRLDPSSFIYIATMFSESCCTIETKTGSILTESIALFIWFIVFRKSTSISRLRIDSLFHSIYEIRLIHWKCQWIFYPKYAFIRWCRVDLDFPLQVLLHIANLIISNCLSY
jgi:hypothetical protein